MAKSKNHTNHNQNKKNHRNGIKKSRRPRKMSYVGMDAKFIRNQRFAKKGMMNESPEAKAARQEAAHTAHQKLMERKKEETAKRLKEFEAEKQANMLKAAQGGRKK
eukprot:GEMP01110953.1.p1 GENE.GEMP01110953.1~~GEMP01110953.1.p1  ORF type:complete len:106 (+),score=28.78 GEMP01110953.1:204-521(+)